MTQYVTDVTTVSSKGQVVLPKAIRDSLQIDAGTKLMVFSDGNSILLKPIPQPDLAEFKAMMNAASAWADEVGMTQDDIDHAIRTVRTRRHRDT